MEFNNNFTIVAVRNPQWANKEHTLIDCEVNFGEIGFEEWSPCTAANGDVTHHGQKLLDELVAGEHGTIAEYEGPTDLGYSWVDPETQEVIEVTHEENSYEDKPRPELD